MKVIYDVRDRMLEELKDICRKDEMTEMDLKNIYKMIDIVKDVTTIDAMIKNDHSYETTDNTVRTNTRDAIRNTL